MNIIQPRRGACELPRSIRHNVEAIILGFGAMRSPKELPEDTNYSDRSQNRNTGVFDDVDWVGRGCGALRGNPTQP